MQSSSPYFTTLRTACGQVLYGWSDKSIREARDNADTKVAKHQEKCHDCKTATTK